MNDRPANATLVATPAEAARLGVRLRQRQPELARSLQEVLSRPASGVEENARMQGLIEALLRDALHAGASDVHLDAVSGGFELRFRIDGALVDTIRIEAQLGRPLARALKTRAELEPAFALRPQEGRAEFQLDGRRLAVRLASAPGVLGEKLALRFLSADPARLGLDQLGLSATDYEQLLAAVFDARGMILISGPTGCGKTTTAYALLQELKPTSRSIVTLEDPVEYVLEGVTQIQVNPRQGLTFADGVKGLMRLDPDVILMGEMRDADSARAALDAADSGHVVVSTLHARDAAGTITALRNFGLADHEIAACVDVVVAQRLVRRLCPTCRKQEPPTPQEAQWLQRVGQPVPARTWHPGQCKQCNQSGYRGRIGIFEVWRLRETEADLILKHADERSLRRHLRRQGTLSLLEDDLIKVADGITTLEEIAAVGGLGFFEPAAVRARGRPTTRKKRKEATARAPA